METPNSMVSIPLLFTSTYGMWHLMPRMANLTSTWTSISHHTYF